MLPVHAVPSGLCASAHLFPLPATLLLTLRAQRLARGGRSVNIPPRITAHTLISSSVAQSSGEDFSRKLSTVFPPLSLLWKNRSVFQDSLSHLGSGVKRQPFRIACRATGSGGHSPQRKRPSFLRGAGPLPPGSAGGSEHAIGSVGTESGGSQSIAGRASNTLPSVAHFSPGALSPRARQAPPATRQPSTAVPSTTGPTGHYGPLRSDGAASSGDSFSPATRQCPRPRARCCSGP